MDIETILKYFEAAAMDPKGQLKEYIKKGKKAIGCFPYYVPEELVHAAGMVPFGIWGSNNKTIEAAKEYFASFYCSMAQLNLEMGLDGSLDGLSGVIVTALCDTLRPLSQNFRVAAPEIPFMFLAHPQNRRKEYGIQYTISRYTKIKEQLEAIAGRPITDADLKTSIKVYNQSRKARREFVKLAGEHPELVTPIQRSAVLKSAYFMLKEEHTRLLEPLNELLSQAGPLQWNGFRIMTSGIIADHPGLLKILEENHMAIAADDVAHESRGFRVDVPEDADPMRALALQFGAQDHDTILYDPEINKRPDYLVKLALDSGSQGVLILMMQFCDPEEMEYPSLKKGLNEAGIPHIVIGVDHQMKNFGQARTQIQAFADVLGL